ncbi:hypothetical protein PVK06_008761 [Gossypium arboreum]|uniref:Uncharacterized protein n=1 Tax=Gossypium arboreum TaxID=29729 RepID=A0ABR0QKR4_GOSAR|nr:hypothetical protein PVK06_008761 [Gossypium arboreum]
MKWEKPPKGFTKINFDTTVGENGIGYGAIARDDEGFVLGGGGGFIELRLSVEGAECVALGVITCVITPIHTIIGKCNWDAPIPNSTRPTN